jgi:hypothetical protein
MMRLKNCDVPSPGRMPATKPPGALQVFRDLFRIERDRGVEEREDEHEKEVHDAVRDLVVLEAGHEVGKPEAPARETTAIAWAMNCGKSRTDTAKMSGIMPAWFTLSGR